MRTVGSSAGVRAVILAGAAAFFLSLAFCIYSFETTMGDSVAEPTSPAMGIVANLCLFTAFAMHHSVFARERVRERMMALVSPQLERSVYVWIASLMLVAVCLAWQPVPGIAWEVAGPAAWLLRALQVAGVMLTLRSAGVLDVRELSGIRQIDTSHAIEFRTSGPYGWVRHPIYAGWFVMVFAEPRMTMTRLVFAAVSGLYLLIAIPLEEGTLRATTGHAYDRYARSVRWRLVPWIY